MAEEVQATEETQTTEKAQTTPDKETTTKETETFAWPETWRAELAAGDDKAAKRLERFASPADIFRSYRALEQRMSSGELKSALKADAKPEEIAAWRAENGIPEAPEKYEIALSEGLIIGDEDKPIINDFLATAHHANLSNEQASKAVQWYYDLIEKQAADQAAADEAVQQKSEDTLRGEWGNDYRANVNLINALLDQGPQDVKDALLGGRTASGVPIGSDPAVLRWLASVAREINPTATVVPAGGTSMANAIEDEIAGLEKKMADRGSDYWKGGSAEKNQSRLRELYTARERLGGKAA